MGRKNEVLARSLVALPEPARNSVLEKLIAEKEEERRRIIENKGIRALPEYQRTVMSLAELATFRDCLSVPVEPIVKKVLGDEAVLRYKEQELIQVDKAVRRCNLNLGIQAPIAWQFVRMKARRASLERKKRDLTKVDQEIEMIKEKGERRIEKVRTRAESGQELLETFESRMTRISEENRMIAENLRRRLGQVEEAAEMAGKGSVKVVGKTVETAAKVVAVGFLELGRVMFENKKGKVFDLGRKLFSRKS